MELMFNNNVVATSNHGEKVCNYPDVLIFIDIKLNNKPLLLNVFIFKMQYGAI